MTRMRWDCDADGCRLKHRWDPADLDGLLPRAASFGDLDAWAEIGGQFLFIEHKGASGHLGDGQRMALKRLAAQPQNTVWVIRDLAGGIELLDMADTKRGFRFMTWPALKDLVRMWGAKADNQSRSAM